MRDHPAVKEYLAREKSAHATPQGADCKAILTAVAGEHDLTFSELRSMVLDATVMGAC